MATVSIRAMASEVGISHTMLSRHVQRGIIRTDSENGRFYPESADRVRRELAANRLSKWRHVPNL
jgi:hypothetical protein